MYQFHNEGFFGYGESGDFTPFTVQHFIPLALIALCAATVVIKRRDLLAAKYERRAGYIFAFVMLLVEMSYFWRLLYVGDETGAGSLMIKLPLQVCQWGLICAVFAITSKSPALTGINFFVTLCLTTPALFVPAVISHTGPAYYRYYQFFLEHGMPLISTVYLMAVHGIRPKYRHLWLSVGLLSLMSVPCVIANCTIPNANYMYLGNYVEGSDFTVDPLSFLPEILWVRYVILFAAVTAIFHAAYFAAKLAAKPKGGTE